MCERKRTNERKQAKSEMQKMGCILSKIQEARFDYAIRELADNTSTLQQQIDDARNSMTVLESKKEGLLRTIRSQRGKQATKAQLIELRDIISKVQQTQRWIERLTVELTSSSTIKSSVQDSALTVSQRQKIKQAIGNIGKSLLTFNPDKINKDIENEAERRDTLTDMNDGVMDTLQSVNRNVNSDVDDELDTLIKGIEEEDLDDLKSIMNSVSVPGPSKSSTQSTASKPFSVIVTPPSPPQEDSSQSPRSPSSSTETESIIPTRTQKKGKERERETKQTLLADADMA